MTDYYLGVQPQRMSYELRSNVARFQSPLSGTVRTLERTGSRLAVTWYWDSVRTSEVGKLRAFLHQQRGGANRFWAAVSEDLTLRGSYSAAELLTNNTFASGTTGWSAGSATTLSAADSVLRLTRTLGAAAGNHYAGQTVTAVQYAPYAMRVATTFQNVGEVNYGASMTSGSDTATSFASTPGLQTAMLVVQTTNPNGYIDQSGQTGVGAGSYREVAYTSFARCALVDNGPNLLQQSDSPEHADWTKAACTASAVAGTSPDGVGDASAIIEDGTNAQHYAIQSRTRSSAAEDLCSFGYFKRRTGTRNVTLYVEDGSNNGANVTFDLGVGTAGSVTLIGTGTNARAFIRSAGDSWYYCAIVARCPASTSARTTVMLHDTTTTTYTGDSTSSIYAWRVGVARTSVPTRGMQTTTAGDDNGTSQTGSALHLKGLPVSTNGLLLVGDWVEIITPTYSELKRVVSPLNSDAAGMGYLQFESNLRASPADNAAVIIREPLGRFLLDESSMQWGVDDNGYQSCQFTAVEDVVA